MTLPISLTLKMEAAKLSLMEGEPHDESEESANQEVVEQIEEMPQAKLRDLRPERDPMGAGRKSLSEPGE